MCSSWQNTCILWKKTARNMYNIKYISSQVFTAVVAQISVLLLSFYTIQWLNVRTIWNILPPPSQWLNSASTWINSVTLKIVAVCSSETSEWLITTRCRNLNDNHHMKFQSAFCNTHLYYCYAELKTWWQGMDPAKKEPSDSLLYFHKYLIMFSLTTHEQKLGCTAYLW
jgi:hypothetical protein